MPSLKNTASLHNGAFKMDLHGLIQYLCSTGRRLTPKATSLLTSLVKALSSAVCLFLSFALDLLK